MDYKRRPVIIAALRTPIARAYGALSTIEAQNLLSPLIQALLQHTKILPQKIDDVIIGNAAGGGGNIARLSALTAGLPVDIAGQTIDRQCGSGLEAIIHACRLIEAGAGSYYLAGGVESISTAPWRVRRPKTPNIMPEFFNRAQFSPTHIGDPEMGVAAENVAKLYHISRTRQDAFALQSHQRAIIAQENGYFDDEIIAIETPQGEFFEDECPRENISMAVLSRLKPVFQQNGTVTAGNSCPLNDGAALVLVTSLAEAQKYNFKNGLLFVDSAVAGVDPNVLGIGPVASTHKLLQRQKWLDLDNISYIEFNEAFAAQVLAALDCLNIDPEDVNLQGGAIALGHAFGASGAVLITRLFQQMHQEKDSPLGLATMGIGGGMGLSVLLQTYCL